MRPHAWLMAASALAATQALPASAAGQSLAARIGAVREGTVLISFAARPGVCGDGHGSTWTRGATMGRSSSDGRWVCMPGPVRVAIGRADGQVASIREVVGGEWNATASETNLGHVPSAEAARYLLQLARVAGGRSSDDAIAAASFADSVDIAPDLDALVRDADAPVQSRKQAMFWLGQSDAPVRTITSLYDGLRPYELREQFVFVLSQRSEDAALAKLIDVARTDPDHEIRKRAMFWLGQSHDPKAIDFLRQILTR